MPIKWKASSRFKPDVILERIARIRSIDANGRASFEGFEIQDYFPALHSMLDFPPAARDIDLSTIVWKGIASVGKDLSKDTFLKAVNAELTRQLSTREQDFILLTSLSIQRSCIPAKFRVLDAEVRVYGPRYPKKYDCRESLISQHPLDVESTPKSYTRVAVKVSAKSPTAAVNKALRALDIRRALWCAMGNPSMQIAYGVHSYSPINVVRLGSKHTLHLQTGKPATEGIWFEPGYVEAKIHGLSKPDIIEKNSKWAIKRLSRCKYGEQIASSLVRYVRALDERDANSAFLGLWGALEALATPSQADYDKLVQRCSFIFKDRNYHRQMLEHLREYRNVYVHAGETSDRARTHCYQLQLYFINFFWFHIANALFFKSLSEVNYFLDSPEDTSILKRQVRLNRKAIKFAEAKSS